MTATVARLRHLNLAALEVAAHSWRRQAQQLAECEDAILREVVPPLEHAGWSGPAANDAKHKIGWLDDQLRVASSTARLIAHALEAAATRWRAIQNRLHQLFEDATQHGLLLDDDGIHLPAANPKFIHFEEYQAQRQQLATAAGLLRRRIHELLEAADRLDAEVAETLGRLQPASPGSDGDLVLEQRDVVADTRAVAVLAGYRQSDLPEHDGDPMRAAEWWRSVAPADRALLLQAFPQHLGSLDGLPADDRDVANRAHLDFCLIDGQGPNRDAAHRLREMLRAADGNRPGQMLLLGFDDAGDGQAVVAIGNPDRAAHTAVFVPGITNVLGNMGSQIDRANDLHHAADLMTPAAGDVSVIAWLGYDTPEKDGSAVGWERSRLGGLSLDSFVNGLNAAHEPSPSHVTAIGHSYGSTVVGEAARGGDGLAVGDIVVAGSPGMHAGDASQLHIDPRHVWAGHAGDDPVSGWLGNASGVHGREPHVLSFGANRFGTDTTGHGGYWQPGSLSLNNQAAIVVGNYSEVQLVHGMAPR